MSSSLLMFSILTTTVGIGIIMVRLWKATEPKIGLKERCKRFVAFLLDAGLSFGFLLAFACVMPMAVSAATASITGIGASFIIQKRLMG